MELERTQLADGTIVEHLPIEVAAAFNPGIPGPFDHEKPLSEREKKLKADLERQVTEAVGKAFVVVGRALATIRDQRLYRKSHKSFDQYTKHLWDMARRTADQYIEAYQVVDQIEQATTPEKMSANCAQNESDSAEEPTGKSATPEKMSANCAQNESDSAEEPTGKSALIRKTDKPEPTIVIPLPANENQARILAKVKDPDERVKVWQAAVQIAQESGAKLSAALIKKVCKRFGHLKIEQATRQIDQRAADAKKEKALSEPIQTALSALTACIRVEERAKWKTCNRQQLADILMSLGKDISLYP